MFQQLGLIGCGLMGGSFALALKRAALVKHVVGYSKSPASAERARQLGVLDSVATSAAAAASNADLVLIAVPVAATEASFEAIAPLVTPQTLLMDVGSTKCDVIAAGRRTLGSQLGSFVPAHPIAGREVSGVEHAQADLYVGAQVILTPIESTRVPQLQQATALWGALGCQVVTMSPESHDCAFAAVSHLPHLISFAVMNTIASQPQSQHYLSLAGPGFRDFTRIAASEATVWRDIMLSNREELLAQSRLFQQQLGLLQALLASGDGAALEKLIEQASRARADWRMVQRQE